MAMQIDLNKVQDLWNCGCIDKEILDSLEGNFSLEDIKQAREEIGVYENRK